MTGTAKVSLYCPPMPVSVVNLRLRRTAAEPMTATIDFEDHTGLLIQNVVIPPTDVHRKGLLHWEVDACVGIGGFVNNGVIGDYITVELPAEPVLFDLHSFSMVAQAITAKVTLTLADGSVGVGTVLFPDCKTDLLTGIAEAVTAVGNVVFP